MSQPESGVGLHYRHRLASDASVTQYREGQGGKSIACYHSPTRRGAGCRAEQKTVASSFSSRGGGGRGVRAAAVSTPALRGW
jgi:hypothetical protein